MTHPTERDLLEIIDERDEARRWADRLARAVSDAIGVDIGEHSNLNNPWGRALDAVKVLTPHWPGVHADRIIRLAERVRALDGEPTGARPGGGPPGSVLLAGIAGSTAYGLAGPDSDLDYIGMYAAPTNDFHGLKQPVESWTSTAPDGAYHEAGKYCRLALAGNPTVQELMWLPEEVYVARSDLGDELIGIRSAFLSAKRVRNTYLGYAAGQLRWLEERMVHRAARDVPDRKLAKRARHLLRLCHQGLNLYRSGVLEIRLPDAAPFFEFGDRVAAGDIDHARLTMTTYEAMFDAVRSPLPDEPDRPLVDRWLHAVRDAHYEGAW